MVEAAEAGTAVVVYDKMDTSAPMEYDDIRRNTALVQKCVKAVMTKDVDYGLIPGCGNKPSLLKPGAEKLMLLFKLGCFPEIEDLSTSDAVKFIVRTKIIHIPTQRELGVGVGSCSSDEEKYKWRRAVCDEEWDATPEERRREKWYAGKWMGSGKPRGKPGSVKQVRTNPADLNNTIIKMAAKRSKVDAVITVCAASDVLAQDLDEVQPQAETPPIQKPQAKGNGEPAKGEDDQIPEGFVGTITTEDTACKGCPEKIKKGKRAAYDPKRGVFHADCVPS